MYDVPMYMDGVRLCIRVYAGNEIKNNLCISLYLLILFYDQRWRVFKGKLLEF